VIAFLSLSRFLRVFAAFSSCPPPFFSPLSIITAWQVAFFSRTRKDAAFLLQRRARGMAARASCCRRKKAVSTIIRLARGCLGRRRCAKLLEVDYSTHHRAATVDQF
jgi:hypothetical protein